MLRSVVSRIGPALPVMGLAELLRNKRASGRHKDLDDVEHLEPLLPGSSR